MTIATPEVNKSIRALLSPALRAAGFQKVETRHNWRYLSDSIWALHLKAVGAYFSSVTGFPPMSLVAELGIYYHDFPGQSGLVVPRGSDGLLLPPITHCYTRTCLELQRTQSALRPSTMADTERRRTDVWWVQPDGSNLEEVVLDIKDSLFNRGIPFLEKPYNTREEQLSRSVAAMRHDV